MFEPFINPFEDRKDLFGHILLEFPKKKCN